MEYSAARHSKPARATVRVMAAEAADFDRAIQERKFRDNLYRRIKMFSHDSISISLAQRLPWEELFSSTAPAIADCDLEREISWPLIAQFIKMTLHRLDVDARLTKKWAM
jgi:hypothetical protein